ncbi:histidine phosphatase family protein [Methylocystis heyeri]|uniref:Histidine phosphatase family protein n=1 Tax=Methylocystis heyeri TaxID=391905 RepID=A0A6B8KGJ6_9HYPH|nr:histidine phosphatase family protein [Methylocystis heyeri]QGM46095.1 hypothetical protein H2LOC_010545 [Methylocystis heyeri]
MERTAAKSRLFERDELMFPILISRHGQVALAKPKFPTRAEFETYVEAYERSGLNISVRPSAELVRHIRAATSVFTSPSLRALESLRLLDPERTPIVDAVFREEPQIIPEIAGRLPLLAWFSLTRGIGSFHPNEFNTRLAMHQRAKVAAELLTGGARQGPVALIGHGWFNRAIAGALVQSGWRRAKNHGGSGVFGRVSSEWGYSVFESGS